MKRQLSLLKETRKNTKLWWIRNQHVYGGALNYRKVARPLDSKKQIHIVFKAKLPREIPFTKSVRPIRQLLSSAAIRYGVVIKDQAVNHDHIHLLIYAREKVAVTHFLRFFAAEMGRKYKEIFRRFGISKAKSLWAHRPFTRLVGFGKRSLKVVKDYIHQNRLEVSGLLPFKQRKHRLTEFIQGLSPS